MQPRPPFLWRELRATTIVSPVRRLAVLWLALGVVGAGCGGPVEQPEPDAGLDAAAPVDAAAPIDAGMDAGMDARALCASDAECDDDVFCNGRERCAPGDIEADERGCAPAAVLPCDGVMRVCHEPAGACLTACDLVEDADGDGHRAMECGGDDCDDGDAARSPSQLEICDPAGVDEDCDPSTFGDRDLDGDGYIDASCCNGERCGSDCDDDDDRRHPGALEVCDGVDNDCDGDLDEGLRGTFYADRDGDGYGAGEGMTAACTQPPGYVLRAGDCDDDDPSRHPGAAEVCNGVDDDCSGTSDDGTATSLCPSDASCIDGVCVEPPAGCDPGFFECDADPSTACDTDVRSSSAHCGGCGNVCAAQHSCVDALCRLRTRASALDLGGGHSCALTPAGTLACWGTNGSGQIGDGTTAPRLRPVLGPLAGVDAVSAGGALTCARVGGAVWCWGTDSTGQLGDGEPDSTGGSAVQVVGLSDAVDVSASGFHACAVRATGEVVCWGAGVYGQLGDGRATQSATPVTVSGLSDAVSVRTGQSFTCALRASGRVRCWGANTNGQLGDGTVAQRNVPVDVFGLSDAVQLSVGSSHVCVVHADGRASCWGANGSGELGQGDASGSLYSSPTPLAVVGVTDAIRIEAGGTHTCLLGAGGRLACWGRDTEGQVGDGDPPPPPVRGRVMHPAPVEIYPSGVTGVSLGGAHTCAIQGGGVSCWGENSQGILGDGTFTSRTAPVALVELSP